MKKIGFAAILSLALPLVAAAQEIGNISTLSNIIATIRGLLNTALPLIIAAAVVYFVWGLFQVITASDEDKKDKAKNTIMYGVIAIFAMVSIWGLVNILYNTFGLDNNNDRGDQASQQLPNAVINN